MEDFLAEDEEFARKIGDDGLKADIEGGTYQGIKKQVMMILSLITFLHILSTDEMFRRRFRMNKPPEVHTSDSPNPCFAEELRRNSAIKHGQHIDNVGMI
jgi:hypothetical protein